MPNETNNQKASEKIMHIINKLDDAQAVELWNEIGEKIHKRIEDKQRNLMELQNKLPKNNENHLRHVPPQQIAS